MPKPPTTFARKLRGEMTSYEKKLWSRLRDRQVLGFKFRRQQPFGPYILDFYCADAKLNVELDGDQHGHPKGIVGDKQRDEFLKLNGVRSLRFWNYEIEENLEGVLETIALALVGRPPHPHPLPRGGEGTGVRSPAPDPP